MDKIKSLYDLWCERATDKAILDELNSIKGDDEAILDRFYRELDFGTAGLRGVIGAGTNRMNIYTVGRATQGFAEYILTVAKNKRVAIGYDSRINSDVFSKTAATVFAANGIKVWLYPVLVPTPMLSFAVRELGCDAGVVVTASHNPSKYNGYKAYGPDGCQLNTEASKEVLGYVEKVDTFDGVKKLDFDEAVKSGMIEFIGNDIFEKYYENVMAQSVNPEILKSAGLKIIYTALNGSGNIPVRTVLSRMGVNDITIVPEQELPDGNFPTVPYPNPEIREAFTLALDLAKKVEPDILLATDPDCDRVGIAVKDGGDYTLMSGNEVGAVMLYYLLSQRTEKGTMPINPLMVKTIVTSRLCDKIAADFGCEVIDILTGFKYIGEQIGILEAKGEENRYIMGFEESYGYLVGSYVRDKDAVIGSLIICEMAAFFKKQNKTLIDVLNELYEKYGVFMHKQMSFAFEGAEGMKIMADTMASLRSNPPKEIAHMTVTKICDYETQVATDTESGKSEAINLPKSNVLAYVLSGGAEAIVRPSGTEPKIKIYLTAIADSTENADSLMKELEKAAKPLLGIN
ncbi:MAG: phospho-sugar mutase [Clostridia bacterium]|nr:phospho-sugar mutase [Clostridia bacterium]